MWNFRICIRICISTLFQLRSFCLIILAYLSKETIFLFGRCNWRIKRLLVKGRKKTSDLRPTVTDRKNTWFYCGVRTLARVLLSVCQGLWRLCLFCVLQLRLWLKTCALHFRLTFISVFVSFILILCSETEA